MIVTLTCNPALDKTIELASALRPGAVQRAIASRLQAAGKGVNVARALHAAGAPTLALLPGNPADPLVHALQEDGLPHRTLPLAAPLRTNITLVDDSGVTTKINEPGPVLDATDRAGLDALVGDAVRALDANDWLVLAGSLPPGLPDNYYAKLTASLRTALGGRCPKIAVDTSGQPLRQLFAHDRLHVPDLIKPNGQELAELADSSLGEDELEARPDLAARIGATLLERGAGAVLATLGAAGAVLCTAQGAWHGRHAPVAVRSTVGAGDSSLAGYLLADTAGDAPADRLRRAIAYGTAAASLPGSTIPTRHDLRLDAVTVLELNPTQGSQP